MLDTVHVFAGLAIGRQITNPVLAFAAGILSHLVLDFIPHWDGGKKGREAEETVDCGLSRAKRKILFWDIVVCLGLGVILSLTGLLWPGFPDFGSLVGFLNSHLSLITGVLGALLWDILSLVYLFIPGRLTEMLALHPWHKKLQNHETPAKIPSLIFQGVLVVIFILLTISR